MGDSHTARLRSQTGPIDRVAARVLGGGIHYEKALPENAKHWRTMAEAPKVIRYRSSNRIYAGPQGIDLTGVRFGHFEVVGYLGRIGKSEGGGRATPKRRASMWLVRCVCGDFEARTTKAIKNPDNAADRCLVCRDVEFRRSGSSDPKEWLTHKEPNP